MRSREKRGWLLKSDSENPLEIKALLGETHKQTEVHEQGQNAWLRLLGTWPMHQQLCLGMPLQATLAWANGGPWQHKYASGTQHLSWWQRGPIEVNLRRSHQNQSSSKFKMDHQNVNQCVAFSESKQTFTRFLVWFGWWKWPHVAWRVSRENE